MRDAEGACIRTSTYPVQFEGLVGREQVGSVDKEVNNKGVVARFGDGNLDLAEGLRVEAELVAGGRAGRRGGGGGGRGRWGRWRSRGRRGVVVHEGGPQTRVGARAGAGDGRGRGRLLSRGSAGDARRARTAGQGEGAAVGAGGQGGVRVDESHRGGRSHRHANHG